MNPSDQDPTYGHTRGPQDGEIRPIPVPRETPDTSPALSEQALTKRELRRKQAQGLIAASGGLATIAFLVIGFTTGGWWWAWVVFLIPGIVKTYLEASE